MPGTARAASPGTRTLRRIGITLLVLIVVLVLADRVGDYAAEYAAGNTIQDSQELRSRPDVDISGVPFLTQLASGDFDQITVTADDVPVGDNHISVDFSEIRVVLDDITVSRDFSKVHADTANALGTISYGELGDTIGIDVSYAGGGRVKAQKSITVLGRTITPTITAAPVLVDGALAFGAAQINGAGSLAGQAASVLNKVFDVSVPLQGIPFKIRVQSISAAQDGLRIRLTGADLTYEKA